MSETIASPTPIFLDRVGNQGYPFPPVVSGTSAVASLTDVPVLATLNAIETRAEIRNLHNSVAANAASVAALRTEMVAKFAEAQASQAAVERRALEASIAAMRAAHSDGLLAAIANKVGAGAA